ncbi:MAG TPA: hypothetical protein VD994_11745 [Prosthecobacter sp.]|nr:hypothetical protein [Prosthecobacter sp.]
MSTEALRAAYEDFAKLVDQYEARLVHDGSDPEFAALAVKGPRANLDVIRKASISLERQITKIIGLETEFVYHGAPTADGGWEVMGEDSQRFHEACQRAAKRIVALLAERFS